MGATKGFGGWTFFPPRKEASQLLFTSLVSACNVQSERDMSERASCFFLPLVPRGATPSRDHWLRLLKQMHCACPVVSSRVFALVFASYKSLSWLKEIVEAQGKEGS